MVLVMILHHIITVPHPIVIIIQLVIRVDIVVSSLVIIIIDADITNKRLFANLIRSITLWQTTTSYGLS